MKPGVLGAVLAALFGISGCSPAESGPGESAAKASAEATGEEVSTAAASSFVNRVWEVAESEQVAPGALRVFLADGTLVMASSQATSALGTWSYVDGRLAIVEEGLRYDVDILELTADAFRIRIHSPGEPVEILFEPAGVPPLPGDTEQPPTER